MGDIVIKPDARKLGIRNPVGCIISKIDIKTDAPELDPEVRDIEERAVTDVESILQSEEVKGSQELFDRLGHPEQLPAGEQLVRLIEKKGLNRHNNIVDAYNIVGGRSGAILGMHDVSQLSGDVTIKRTDGGERMTPIFHDEPETASEGDLVWEMDNSILALLGPVSRDSDAFKVTESTDKVLLMAPGNENTTEEYNRDLCQQTFDLIQKTCPDAELEFLDIVRKETVAH